MIQADRLLRTQVPGLDTILGGGIARDALVLIIGAPGAGKTILASQILFNAIRAGMPALVLTTFSEGHTKLLGHLRELDFFDEAAAGTTLTLLSLETLVEGTQDTTVQAITKAVRQTDARLL